MNKYEELELEIITFSQEDVILTSNSEVTSTEELVLPPVPIKT